MIVLFILFCSYKSWRNFYERRKSRRLLYGSQTQAATQENVTEIKKREGFSRSGTDKRKPLLQFAKQSENRQQKRLSDFSRKTIRKEDQVYRQTYSSI